MAASSKQKSPYIAGMVCAGKGKEFLDQNHENGLSVRAGGTAAAAGQQYNVHRPQEQRQGHDTCMSSAQWLTPHCITRAMHSL